MWGFGAKFSCGSEYDFFVNICQWEMNFLFLFSLTESVLRVCFSYSAVRVD